MTGHNMDHMAHLEAVAAADVAQLRRKEATYRGSWKRSGGRSAWHMLRRKIDRLLVMMSRPEPSFSGFSLEDILDATGALQKSNPAADVTMSACVVDHLARCYAAEDVFAMIDLDPSGSDGTVLAEVRDLRQYLLLVEAEVMARAAPKNFPEMLRDTVDPAVLHVIERDRQPGSTTERGSDVSTWSYPQLRECLDYLDKTIQEYPTWGAALTALDEGRREVVAEIARRKPGQQEPPTQPPVNVVINHEGRITPLEAEAYISRMANTPHTDSNRHAMPERLEDGLRSLVGVQPHMYFWTTAPAATPDVGYWNVDRRTIRRSLWEHLPRLDRELNHKEWELTRPEYCGMYRWEEGPSKWTLAPEYLEHWGREP